MTERTSSSVGQRTTVPGTQLLGAVGRQRWAVSSRTGWLRLGTAALLGALLTGCSIKKMAVNKLGNGLASGGTVFASDDDPELIRAAVPFSLKLMESLLAENPRHAGLLFATASGFTQYAFAFVQQDADEMEDKDAAVAEAMRQRARRLYVRARNYGLRGLALAHPNFEKELRQNPKTALRTTTRNEVPLLYWTAASWGSAISLSKDDPQLISEVPQVEALIDRALELDEAWNEGALHGFLVSYEMSRQGAAGDAAERSRKHFTRAMELAGGKQAGPLVSYAESVCMQKQDLKQFESLLNQALAINADTHPNYRLVNLVMQRRARWLLSKKEDLFLIPEKPAAK